MIEVTNVLHDYPRNRRFCESVEARLKELGRKPEIVPVKKNGHLAIQLIDHCTPIYESAENKRHLFPRIIGFK